MLGIDLGDDHSLVATCHDSEPRVLSDRSGACLIPSAVAATDGGEVLVGDEAQQYLTRQPKSGQAGFYRDVGGESRYEFGGRSWTADECTTELLKHLRRIAVQQIGEVAGPVVVAVPTYFHDGQRTAVLNAARAADLSVFRLINKPTAAALAYCYENPNNRTLILVLDLRARGFDVTLLKVEGLGFEVLSTNGVAEFDSSVADDPDRLWKTIFPAIERAMKDARIPADELDDILLTGETKSLTHLGEQLRETFGHPGNTNVNPDQAVALGAAIYAKAFGSNDTSPAATTRSDDTQSEGGCLGVVLAFLAIASLLGMMGLSAIS